MREINNLTKNPLQVDRHYLIPTRAIGLITVVLFILGLINIGSSTAFNAIISITLIGQYTSYALPIILMVMRRFNRKHIPFGPWTLGRLGLPINCCAIGFSALIITFMVFPPYQPVTAENMNYASAVLGVAVVISAASWFATGRNVYTGPVKEVIENLNVRRV